MYLDICLLTIVFISVFLGYKKGVLLEIFSFVGVIVAVLATKTLTPKIIKFFKVTVDREDKFNYILLYFIVFCILYLLIIICTSILKKISQGGILRSVDQLIGGIVGLLKGLIIALVFLVLVIFFSKYSKKVDEFGKKSYSKKYFLEYSSKFEGVLPKEIKNMLEDFKYEGRIEKYLEE